MLSVIARKIISAASKTESAFGIGVLLADLEEGEDAIQAETSSANRQEECAEEIELSTYDV